MKHLVLALLLLTSAACHGRRGGGSDDDDDNVAADGDADGDGDTGGPEEEDRDPYWCCDPDHYPCECQGYWHCTETEEGKHCSQDNPFLPDDGGTGSWACAYVGDLIVCSGTSSEHPDAGADGAWDCETDEFGAIECSRETTDEDYPDEEGDAPWDCEYADGGEMRNCDSEDEVPPDDGDGGQECTEWELDCDDGEDEDCNGLTDCSDPNCSCGGDDEVCDGRDNDLDGRIDEGRACGDAGDGEGACPPGAFRICDAYCGVHQQCGPEGMWGPCLVDGSCALTPDCDQHSDCPRGEYCDFGGCTPGTLNFFACEGDSDCDFGFGIGISTCQLDQGVCIQDCYHHSDCGAGLVCDLGMCVEDPYVPGQC